jgi:hypothetical protein
MKTARTALLAQLDRVSPSCQARQWVDLLATYPKDTGGNAAGA